MRILLDSHVLVWWLYDAPALSPRSREILSDTDNALIVSAATAWELAIKFQAKKLPAAAELIFDFAKLTQDMGFDLLPISAEHGIRAGLLPGPHKDPFDRMLIAQAQIESTPIVSSDVVFDSYGVYRMW